MSEKKKLMYEIKLNSITFSLNYLIYLNIDELKEISEHLKLKRGINYVSL